MSPELKQILENHKELIILTEHLDGLSEDLSDRDWNVALAATAYLEQLLEVVIKTNGASGLPDHWRVKGTYYSYPGTGDRSNTILGTFSFIKRPHVEVKYTGVRLDID